MFVSAPKLFGRTLLGTLFLLGAVGPTALLAQQGEKLNVPARTHWAAKGRSVAAAQNRQMATDTELRPNLQRIPQSAVVGGIMKQVLLPINFINEDVKAPVSAIQDNFYGNSTGSVYSVSRYYAEVSGGAFGVEGSVLNPVLLPKTSAQYVGKRDPAILNGVGDHLAEMIGEALSQSDRFTDWSEYLEPGENQISAVVFLTAGQGGNCGGDVAHFWPHRYNLTELTGGAFETNDKNEAGETVVIDDYILVPSEECLSGMPAAAGVVIHETGHLLGLPDLYNVQDASNRGPVGHFDLMATGNYNLPQSPAMLGAPLRALLGWVGVLDASPGNVVIPSVASSREVYRISMEGTGEYLLLETRTRTGSDSKLPGEGLLIWHVDGDKLEETRLNNLVNADPSHWSIALIQADGRSDLENGTNRGDAGDVWPGSSQAKNLSSSSSPALKAYSSKWDGAIALTGISYTGGSREATFKLALDAAEEPQQGEGRILPQSLSTLVVGSSYKATFRLEGVEIGENAVSWKGDAALFASLGLQLDTSTGILSGTVADRPAGKISFDITAEVDGKSVATRSFEVQLLRPLDVSTSAIVSGVLGQRSVLSVAEVQYVDALGNQNGSLDIGDFVLLVRSGHLTLTPAEKSRYRALLPAELR